MPKPADWNPTGSESTSPVPQTQDAELETADDEQFDDDDELDELDEEEMGDAGATDVEEE
jgi:hypothetical protein